MTEETRYDLPKSAMLAWVNAKSGNARYWTINDFDEEAIYWREVWMMGATDRMKEGYNQAVSDALAMMIEAQDAYQLKFIAFDMLSKKLESLRK